MGVKTPESFTCEVDTPAKEGEGKARRHYLTKGKDLLQAAETDTVLKYFDDAASRSPNRPFIGNRKGNDPFVFQTYREVQERTVHLGGAMVHHNIGEQEMVGIWMANCPEWVLIDFACQRYNIVSVPMYDTLGEEAMVHIVNECEIKLIFISKKHIKSLFKLQKQMPSVKTIVVTEIVLEDDWIKLAEEADVKILSMPSFEKKGKDDKVKQRNAKSKSIHTICYTSGTTGVPKGVVQTQNNICSVVCSMELLGRENLGVKVDDGEVYLSYLPLAHTYERTMQALLVKNAATIGFFRGDPKLLKDDIGTMRPTVFPSVPRVLNKFYDVIHGKVEKAGGMKAKLFHKGVDSKKAGLVRGRTRSTFWDALIFNKVRKEVFGGRVKAISSGSAAISRDVLDFFRLSMGCDVYEGYGQTETCAVATTTPKGDLESGHVGAPIPCIEVKLVDVPELGYTSADKPCPRGEVCFRGPSIMTGYYKQAEKTSEAVDEDGWLHSGDIGLWDAKGRLQLIDRKKNIFKLAQGEYVAPEKIENIYNEHLLVGMIFVHGEPLESSLVGVIVPNEEIAMDWAKDNGIDGDFEALCKNDKFKAHLLKDINALAKERGLKGFEMVRAIHLDHELFSVEKDLITPTFKAKRPQLKAYYTDAIAKMYTEINNAEGGQSKANAAAAAAPKQVEAAATTAQKSAVEE